LLENWSFLFVKPKGEKTMKKNLTILFSVVLIFGFTGISSGAFLPYGIGDVENFLGDSTFFNGYSEITDPFDFSGTWEYTAIAFESGNINYIDEGGLPTFTTAGSGNFGVMDLVNFDTDNLFFSDSDGPYDNALDDFDPADGFFRLFQLDHDSNALSYLSTSPVFSAGTYIVGFNDNGSPAIGDSDFDDIIMAAQRVSEPATMLLLGFGLIGMAGLGRRKFKKNK
jgi:hypothetical protein